MSTVVFIKNVISFQMKEGVNIIGWQFSLYLALQELFKLRNVKENNNVSI